MTDPSDATTIPAETRRELVTAVLILLETFSAEHGLGLDFIERMTLLELALDDLDAALTPTQTH